MLLLCHSNGKPTKRGALLAVLLAVLNSVLYLYISGMLGVVVWKPHHNLQTTNTTLEKVVVGGGGVSETQKTNAKTTPKRKKKKKKFNVVLFYPDDLRHDTIGVAGTQPVQTPFLDQLSHDGIRFTHNAVTTSVCWISRATMITGQYLSRHQSRFIGRPIFYERWNETYPYLLQQNGYYVGHVGKWQYANPEFVDQMYNWTSLYYGFHSYEINGRNVPTTVRDEEESIRFLRERPQNKPFVLTTAFYAPKAIGENDNELNPMEKTEHLYDNVTIPLPLDPELAFLKLPKFMVDNAEYLEGRRRYRERFDFNVPGKYEAYMKKYYRMVTEVDEAIRNIVAELDRQGIVNDTVIIYTTDNGYFHGEHGLAGKWFPYQESIRVPLIIRDPRMPPNKIGTLNDAFTLNIDLATTILGAAGLPPHPRMQGRDMADLYLEKQSKKRDNVQVPWRNEYYYEHPEMLSNGAIPASSALVRKDFKYMVYPDYNHYELLFDLQKDPLEHNDLAQRPEYANLLTEMRTRHDQLQQSVV